MNISVSFGLRPPSWSEKVNERGNRRTFEYVPPRIKRPGNRQSLRQRPRTPVTWSKVKVDQPFPTTTRQQPLANGKQIGSERH